MLRDNRHIMPLSPGLQLLDSRRPEGITRCEHDVKPLLLESVGQLANRGGFAGAIDPDYQNDKGLSTRRVQRGFLIC